MILSIVNKNSRHGQRKGSKKLTDYRSINLDLELTVSDILHLHLNLVLSSFRCISSP